MANALTAAKARHVSFVSEMCTCTERTESGQFVLALGQRSRQPSPGRGLPPAAGTSGTTVRVLLDGVATAAAGA